MSAESLLNMAASARHVNSGQKFLQIDNSMMSELQGIQQSVKPSDTLLVVDAMTGQEAAGLVKAFNDAAPLTGES